MKKLFLRRLLIILIILVSFTEAVRAESITFGVSCTIPALPGINAPPYDDKAQDTKNMEQLRAAKAEQAMAALEKN